MRCGRFANVSQCFITGIMAIRKRPNGYIRHRPHCHRDRYMYYDCAVTALILSVGSGRQGCSANYILSTLFYINISHDHGGEPVRWPGDRKTEILSA